MLTLFKTNLIMEYCGKISMREFLKQKRGGRLEESELKPIFK